MTTPSTSAGTVAYDSHGSGDPIALLPSAGHERHGYDETRKLLPDGAKAGKIAVPAVPDWGRYHQVLPLRAAKTARDLIPGSGLAVIESGRLPHTTSPAAAAAELGSLANSAFDGASRTNDPQNRPPATKEQQ